MFYEMICLGFVPEWFKQNILQGGLKNHTHLGNCSKRKGLGEE